MATSPTPTRRRSGADQTAQMMGASYYNPYTASTGASPYAAPPSGLPLGATPPASGPINYANAANASPWGAGQYQQQGATQMPSYYNQPVNPYRPGPNYNPDYPNPGMPGMGMTNAPSGGGPGYASGPYGAAGGAGAYGTAGRQNVPFQGVSPATGSAIGGNVRNAIPFFGSNYLAGLASSGLDPVSGSPASEFMQSLSGNAFAGYLNSLFAGTGNPNDTSGAIRSFLNGGWQTPTSRGDLGNIGSMISSLLNANDTGNLAGLSNPQALGGLQQLLANPNQALAYAASLLAPAGLSNYTNQWLQKLAQRNAAMGNQADPNTDYARSILNIITQFAPR